MTDTKNYTDGFLPVPSIPHVARLQNEEQANGKRISEHPFLFWASDDQWARLGPTLPSPHRLDDRRALSGLMHIMRGGPLFDREEYGGAKFLTRRAHEWGDGLWYSAAMCELIAEYTARGVYSKAATLAESLRDVRTTWAQKCSGLDVAAL